VRIVRRQDRDIINRLKLLQNLPIQGNTALGLFTANGLSYLVIANVFLRIVPASSNLLVLVLQPVQPSYLFITIPFFSPNFHHACFFNVQQGRESPLLPPRHPL
jgi:hypothetical protein